MNAKQRELKESWEELVKKTAPKKIFKEKLSVEVFNTKKYVRETPKIASLDTGHYNTFKKTVNKYTGNNMKGIGTLHKSNAVPIFTDEEAKDQASMRR